MAGHLVHNQNAKPTLIVNVLERLAHEPPTDPLYL